MKHFLYLLLLLTGMACSQKTSDEKIIEKTAKNYLTAFKNMNFEEAKKYGNDDAKLFLQQMENAVAQSTPEEYKKMKEGAKKGVSVALIKTVVADSLHATVSYKFVMKNQDRPEETLYLVKENGEWKVTEFIN